MSEKAFKKLIGRYADGMALCNCGQAYYTNCGVGRTHDGIERNDLPACQHGCSANQIGAKEYVARRVVEEFGI